MPKLLAGMRPSQMTHYFMYFVVAVIFVFSSVALGGRLSIGSSVCSYQLSRCRRRPASSDGQLAAMMTP